MRKILGILPIFSFFAIIGCSAPQAPPEVSGGLPVEVIAAKRGTIQDRISLIGTLMPWEQVQVYSKVPGKLQRNLVREGDHVGKGKALALIDRDEVGVRFKPAPVESPMDGVVGKLFLDPGAAAAPGVPVAAVVNVRKMKASAGIIEADIARVREGQKALVRVEAYPGEEFEGAVRTVSPLVDPVSRTTRVEVELANPDGKLRPGMYARVDIVVGEKDKAVVIPKTAVLHKKGKSWVFVANDGTADMREVVMGYDDLDRVEIVDGVREGERVVVSSLSVLQKGTRVKETEKP